MTGPHLRLALVVVLTIPYAAEAQIFPRKSKPDAARVRSLGESLRTDPDEKRRRAAIAELKEAEARAQTDAVLVLAAVLERDPSPVVRTEAATAIGQIKLMVPRAGVALELAAENDPSPQVRDAAQQALWEYHLIGYRSARGADGIAGQTREPPLAKAASARASGESVPPVVAISATPIPDLPQPEPPVAPLVALPKSASPTGIRTLVTAAPPPLLNVNPEPPLSRPEGSASVGPDSPVSETTLPPVTLPPEAALKTATPWTPPRVIPSVRPLQWLPKGSP